MQHSCFDVPIQALTTDPSSSCARAWTGATCGELNLKPARLPPNSGFNEAGNSSWGGSIFGPDESGLYHMYASRMAGHCGLNTWAWNSELVRATSTDPVGPYTYQETLLPYFAHG